MVFILFPLLLNFFFSLNFKPTQFSIEGSAQGTSYKIIYFNKYERVLKYEIDSIFLALDKSLSVYQPNSLISIFNKQGFVKMDEHLENVVNYSISTFYNSNGIFDITVLPLVNAWGFGTEVHSNAPDSATLKELKSCINTNLLFVRNDTLFRKKDCVKIDVNGIAQGYSVDVIADFLKEKKINSFLIELGGEIYARGSKPKKNNWIIAVEKPNEENDFIAESYFQLFNQAVTTSGNYKRFYESDGKIISHIINPLSGYPVDNELISVSVAAPNAFTADAYDNVLMVMGLNKSFEFLNDNPQLGAYFIYKNPEGNIKDTAIRFLKPAGF